MNITVEALILSAVFLLPGYAAQRLTGSFARNYQKPPSAFDSLLTSLGITIAIFLVEALFISAAAVVVYLSHERWLEDLDLDILVRQGIREYTLVHPWVVVIAVLSIGLSTAAAAFCLGVKDPAGTYIEKRQLALGLAPDDLWLQAFDRDREHYGYKFVNASIRLKESGDEFRGRVRGVSIPRGEEATRDIYLHHVTVVRKGQPPRNLWTETHPLSGAVISSDQIASIELLFEK